VRGISIVAWPLENGEPKPDWKPGTDTIADIRPGSFLQRSYQERQRKPDDLEAQEGQRPIAIHALENLAHSDTGIVMLGGYCASNCSVPSTALTRSTSCATRRPTGAFRPAPGTRFCRRPKPPHCPTAKTSERRSAVAAGLAVASSRAGPLHLEKHLSSFRIARSASGVSSRFASRRRTLSRYA
jgi:hypothetical protein